MSIENQDAGFKHYADNSASHQWFERQWRIWPRRADEACTTNISFLYGGVLAYREEHGRDPAVSDDYRANIRWLDRHPTTDSRNGRGE